MIRPLRQTRLIWRGTPWLPVLAGQARELLGSPELNEMHYRLPQVFVGENLAICFTDPASQKPFMPVATQQIPDLHLVGAACGTQCLPLYRYPTGGERVENITDWALAQFRQRYGPRQETPSPRPLSHGERGEERSSQGERGEQRSSQGERGEQRLSPWERRSELPSPRGGGAGGEGELTKLDIFRYAYAVLHHPAYCQKYELNLKREFPRVPFYDDFWQWSEWGRRLMDLHLNYEQALPYPLSGEDLDAETLRRAVVPRLIARKEKGVPEMDTLTTLRGVPPDAWEYRRGTYTALEGVLERYKERKPKDPTIRERLNTYRFADYKEHVIDLLRRVCTVSVQTMAIIRQMPPSTSPEDAQKAR